MYNPLYSLLTPLYSVRLPLYSVLRSILAVQLSLYSIYQILHIQVPQHQRYSGSLVVAILWLVCTSCSLTVDIAILTLKPLTDHVTNRNSGLWGPRSQISCEHVLWSSLDDQIYWFCEYHVARAPNITLNEQNRRAPSSKLFASSNKMFAPNPLLNWPQIMWQLTTEKAPSMGNQPPNIKKAAPLKLI